MITEVCNGRRFKAKLIGENKYETRFQYKGRQYKRRFYGRNNFKTILKGILDPKKQTEQNMSRRRKRKPRKKGEQKDHGQPVDQAFLPGLGMPDSMLMKFKYTGYFPMVTVSNITSKVFRGNSLYDPDHSSQGSDVQPYYFDQWAAFYNKYTVYASEITVVATNILDVREPIDFAIVPLDNSTAFTDGQLLEMFPKTVEKTFSVGGNQTKTIRHYQRSCDALGVEKEAIGSEEDYSAAMTANPDSTWYWHCVGFSFDATTSINFTYKVTIIYYARLWEKKVVPISLI